MRSVAPLTASPRLGLATTLWGNLHPGRYLTFSCSVLIISVNLRPFTSSSYTHICLHHTNVSCAKQAGGQHRVKRSTSLVPVLRCPHCSALELQNRRQQHKACVSEQVGLERAHNNGLVLLLYTIAAHNSCNGTAPVATANDAHSL